jgi:DNA-binding NarL/FixJ family response regulator
MADIEKINVIIADSQFLTNTAIKALFAEQSRFVLLDMVDNAYQLKKSLTIKTPEILVTDVTQMDYDSIDDLQVIQKEFPKMAIVVLTNVVNKSEFQEFNKAGIKNIITKTIDKKELFEALDAANRGKKYYSSDILDLLIELQEKKSQSHDLIQLTASEIEIVRQIAEGLTTKEIAERKNISFHTVMTHRKNIFRKLGINNAPELLMYAMKAGLIDNLEYYI